MKLFCILLTLLATLHTFAAEAPREITFEEDITYGTVDGVELKLNIARPRDSSEKLPCILVIHGGGWAAGDRSAHDDMVRNFARMGYVSATIGYRFAPMHPFPAQVQDVKCAARFLRASADKFGIDTTRFGAVGFSAGAHLSMMLGAMDESDGLDDSGGSKGYSSKVQAVVAFFGPTDFSVVFPDASRNIVKNFLGGTQEEKAEAHRRASPITYISKGDAPMLLFQGTKDILVPHDQAIRMVEAMTAAGIPGRVEFLIGAGHGWRNPDLARTFASTIAFFNEHLATPSVAPPK